MGQGGHWCSSLQWVHWHVLLWGWKNLSAFHGFKNPEVRKGRKLRSSLCEGSLGWDPLSHHNSPGEKGSPWQGWALFVLAAGLPGQSIWPSGHCSLDFRLDLREDSPRAERPIINKKSPWVTASSKEPQHSRVAGVWFSHFRSSLTQASSLLGIGDSQVTWGGREPLFKGCVFLEGSTSDD